MDRVQKKPNSYEEGSKQENSMKKVANRALVKSELSTVLSE
jgi:hypothetical protein